MVELASEAGETTNDSMRAAISGLQLEADGIVSNLRRDPRAEANGVKSFDYLADGPNGETHLEIKRPVGSEIKKLIIDLLDELKAFDLIEAGFDIVYKDGKKPEKGVKMLTPSILSQSKEIFLHEIIDSNN